MSPRRLLNLLRSPAGALVLFLLGFALLLFLVNSRGDSSDDKSSGMQQPKASNSQQLTQSVEREITPFRPAPTTSERKQTTAPVAVKAPNASPELPSLSLVAETPSAEAVEKPMGEKFAPFGRLGLCGRRSRHRAALHSQHRSVS